MPPTSPPWKRSLSGLLALTRYREFYLFVIVTTLLGARAAGAPLDWRLPLILVANWLAVGFAFMYNDLEDAPDDALSAAKVGRNPVSAGLVSPGLALRASLAVAALSALAYLPLGWLPFLLGALCLGLGWLYSWRRVRLKSIPLLDLVSHVLMLAGLQLACAYFTYAAPLSLDWLAPFLLVVAVSAYGELFNELRDFEGDRQAGINHTAALIGERAARRAMYACLVVAGLALAALLLSARIPPWVLGVGGGAAALLLAGPALRAWRGQSAEHTVGFQEPVLALGGLMLTAWVIGSYFGL
jgi:4-hydroxybenzoate polyprenyltransferase